MKGLKEDVIFQSSDDLVSLSVQVDAHQETVWLSLTQIAHLFERDKSVISRHFKRIFETQELSRDSVVAFFATTAADGKTYNVEFFNLDAILSVGYRVNSKRGIEFRRWASNILKDYLLKGYSHNEERLLKIGLRDSCRSLDLMKQSFLMQGQTDLLSHATLDIIRSYAKSWMLLNAYDEKTLFSPGEYISPDIRLTLGACLSSISHLKEDLVQRGEASSLFGRQKGNGLDQIVGAIHQTFDGHLLYPSVYERAAHLFYFILKDHPFIDGNKRIGSFLLLLYLSLYDLSLSHISNESLVALALLVAQSKPGDKDILLKLILHLITQESSCV